MWETLSPQRRKHASEKGKSLSNSPVSIPHPGNLPAPRQGNRRHALLFGAEEKAALWQQVTALLNNLPDALTFGFTEAEGDKTLEDFAQLALKQPDPQAFATGIRDLLTQIPANTPSFRKRLFETVEKEGMAGLADVQDLAVKLQQSGWLQASKPPATSRLFPNLSHHNPWKLIGQKEGTSTDLDTALENLMALNLCRLMPLGVMRKHLEKLSKPSVATSLTGKVFMSWLRHAVQHLDMAKGKEPQDGTEKATEQLHALIELSSSLSQAKVDEDTILDIVSHVCTRNMMEAGFEPGARNSELPATWQKAAQLLKNTKWPTPESREAFVTMLGKVWTPQRLSSWQETLLKFPGPPYKLENFTELLISLDRKLTDTSPKDLKQIRETLFTLTEKYTSRNQFDSMMLVLQELILACNPQHTDLRPVRLLARADMLTEQFLSLPPTCNLMDKLEWIKAVTLQKENPAADHEFVNAFKALFSDITDKTFISEQVFLMLKRTGSLEKTFLAKKWLLVFDRLLTQAIKDSPPQEASRVKDTWKSLFRFITLTAWDKIPLNRLEVVFNGLAAWMEKNPAPSPPDNYWLDTARQSLEILFGYLHAGVEIPIQPEHLAERLFEVIASLRQHLGDKGMAHLFSKDFAHILSNPGTSHIIADPKRLAAVAELARQIPEERRDASLPLLLYLLPKLCLAADNDMLPAEQWPSQCQGLLDVLLECPEYYSAHFERRSGSDNPPSDFRKLIDVCVTGVLEGHYPETLTALLSGALALQKQLKEIVSQSGVKPFGWEAFMWDSVQQCRGLKQVEERVQSLCSLMMPEQSLHAQTAALEKLLKSDFDPEQIAFLQPILQKRLSKNKTLGHTGILLANPVFREMHPDLLEKILNRFEELEAEGTPQQLSLAHSPMVRFLPEMAQLTGMLFTDYPKNEILVPVLDLILALPNHWKKTGEVFHFLRYRPGNVTSGNVSEEEAIADPAIMHAFQQNARFLAYSHFPTRLLNHFMLNQSEIRTSTLQSLYSYVEYGGAAGQRLGKKALAELMALLVPYGSRWDSAGIETQKDFMAPASGALTSLYRFSSDTLDGEPIPRIDGIVLNNWAKIGTAGLSFTKWQWDAMRRWKGQGPMEQLTLLEKSGLFKRIPPRADDATYQAGFLHYDPARRVSVELRRAYMVISKPGLGTLVIRNSSPVFGRNLMPEPAYFSPTAVASDVAALFSPQTDLKGADFQSVFSKRLHTPMKVQLENHEKIQALLQVFDEVMTGYTQWKCGFQKGRQPEGFGEILKTAMMSANNEGVSSPFGGKKNIRPVWVNPFGLPMPLASFDVTKPELQAEIAFYLSVLGKKNKVLTAKEYETKIPNLLAFLKLGLEQGWELVLKD